MGRVGACGDNATMEPFNSLLQKNVFNQQRWSTRDEPRLAAPRWIGSSCNRRRRQRELGKLTPVEFETVYSFVNAASIKQPHKSADEGADPTDSTQ